MGLDDAVMLDVAHAHDLLGQGLGNDIHLTVVLVLYDSVALAWMQGDGEVAGERPNRGRPDHEVQLGLVEVAQLAEVVVHGELDIDGGAAVSYTHLVNNYAHELLAKDFGLTLTDTQDAWGRPTHTWSKGANEIGEYIDSDTVSYTHLDVYKRQGPPL